MFGGKPREVIYGEHFEAQARALIEDARRFDEFFHAIEWTLARSNHIGAAKIRSAPAPGLPYVEVQADMGNPKIVLTGIRLIDDRNGD